MVSNEHDRPESAELKISKDGVELSGTAYDDFRPLIKSGVDAVEPMIKFVGHLIGLPLDLATRYLGGLREKYSRKLEAIPPESRQPPSLRIGCGILQKAVASADEDSIQEMFAELLATASDSRRSAEAHPAFATVISELQPEEAVVLALINKNPKLRRWLRELRELINGDKTEQHGRFERAIPNLLRLGLVEWITDKASDHSISRGSALRRLGWYREVSVKDLNSDLERFSREVEDVLREMGRIRGIELTEFGAQFMKACLPSA